MWVRQLEHCLLIHNREFFAFVDSRKKEWDYTEHTDSLVGRRDALTNVEREEHARKQQELLAVWNFLPRAQQGMFAIEAFLPYADILLLDPEGDAYHNYPHLYVEFTGPSGPFSGFLTHLSLNGAEVELDDTWHRIDFFPRTFSRSAIEHRIHRTEKINLDTETLKGFVDHRDRLDALYAVDNRFDFLRQRDIIAVANSARRPDQSDVFLQIMHIQKGPFLEYLNDRNDYRIRQAAKRQIGREITDEEQVTILEVETTYMRQ